MPVSMSFSPAFRSSPRNGGGGIENGNKLGARPVVRQSKIYRERESGNAMKSLFGQDHLSWDTQQQQGVFEGQSVYDAENHTKIEARSPPSMATGTSAAQDEIEYPNPGCNASCDACGQVVTRFYHCADCLEETGLFDLCTECCAAIYLKQGSRANMPPPPHATHSYASHRMVQICPPGT